MCRSSSCSLSFLTGLLLAWMVDVGETRKRHGIPRPAYGGLLEHPWPSGAHAHESGNIRGSFRPADQYFMSQYVNDYVAEICWPRQAVSHVANTDDTFSQISQTAAAE